MLNKMNAKQLAVFLADNGGRIDVNQLSDDEYTLKAKVHGKGGGYWVGQAFAWIVRGIGYGVPAYLAANKLKEVSHDARHSDNVFIRETATMSHEYIDSAINVGIPQTVISRNIVDGVGEQNAAIAVTTTAMAAQQGGMTYVSLVEWAAAAAQAGGQAIWFLP